MKKILLLFLVLLTAHMPVQSQINLELERQLDTLYSPWRNAEIPGMVSGIVKDGKVVYLKAHGVADIESGREIDLQTKFQTDDLSKQFTVLSVLLLEQQGKIVLSDPIKKYIPAFQKYSEDISVNHLLNHSTGLDDYVTVRLLTGANNRDALTHQDAMALILSQKELNFKPGTEFSMRNSDTEYTLMTELVEQVSGRSLQEFANEYIFQPLKMRSTLFVSDSEMLIPGLAKSYQNLDGEIRTNTILRSTPGPTNLYSSGEDMAIWYQQFSPKVKSPLSAIIKKLHQTVKLDNGRENNSSWGRMTLARDFWHKERGADMYWLFGLTGGYGANVFAAPDADVTSFVLGNNNQYNGYFAMSQFESFMEDLYTEPDVVRIKSDNTSAMSLASLKKYEGDYWEIKANYARRIYVKNDTLRFFRPEQDRESSIVPIGNDTFQMVVQSDDVIILNFDFSGATKRLNVVAGIGDPEIFESYTPKTYSASEIKQFEGIYFSEELNTNYSFTVEGDVLVGNHLKNGKITFTPIMEDIFRGDRYYLECIKFKRDGKEIESFEVSTFGIGKRTFKKVAPISKKGRV